MKYDEARQYIQDGDIVLVRSAHSLFGWLTKLFTGVYTHSGVAVWIEGGLWMVEINGGRNHAIPLSQLSDVDFDVYYPPNNLDRMAIKTVALRTLRVMIPYGFVATIVIGINEFFGINRFIHWRKIIICSGYVVEILDLAGWSEHSYIVSPTKLSELLLLKLEVRK